MADLLQDKTQTAPIPVYKRGSKNDEVGKIQTALGDYYTGLGGKVDNWYGPKTHNAVFNWQTQWNNDNPNDQIKVDGKVGSQTYPRLMQWYAAKNTPVVEQPAAPQPVVEAPAAQPAPQQTAAAQETADPNSSAAIQQSQIDMMDKNIDPLTMKPVAPVDEASADEAGKSPYLTDWSKVKNPYEEAKRLNVPLAQVLQDYWKWGNDTGNPTYWLDAMLQDYDLKKTAAENEEDKKKQERKERWDKFSNFLLHLGNAIGNVGGGGYASMNLENPIQWSERQRMLKEKADELRRNNNLSYYQRMRQGFADQRNYEMQKQRMQNEQLKLSLQKELAEARRSNDELKAQLIQANIDRLNRLTPLLEETERTKAKKNLQQGDAAMINARKKGGSRGGGNSTTIKVTENELNDDGKVTKSTQTTTKIAGVKSGRTASAKPSDKISTGISWKHNRKSKK